MKSSDQYHCFYLDHTFFDARVIGALYSELTQEHDDSAERSLLLATCQRIELYTLDDNNPFAARNLPFKKLSGLSELRRRLISIASGATSQILGEKNIYLQVKNACRDSPTEHPLKNIFLESLEEAAKIRSSANFAAEMDYEDVSIEILKDACPEEYRSKLSLVIVGSGMLARSFLKKELSGLYNDMYFITRSPKNLKKKLDTHLKKNVIRPEDFKADTVGPYQCIIASNHLDKGGYDAGIRAILSVAQCLGIFDLSAVPLFTELQNKVFYADTYSSLYYSLINTYNEAKLHEAALILGQINESPRKDAGVHYRQETSAA